MAAWLCCRWPAGCPASSPGTGVFANRVSPASWTGCFFCPRFHLGAPGCLLSRCPLNHPKTGLLAARYIPEVYGREPGKPIQRLRAITFVVVNRFSKTRRISRALAVAHPRARGAYASPPASFSSGLRPALVRCQVAQGARSRAGFAARGGGGGVGMVLGRASARWMYVRLGA